LQPNANQDSTTLEIGELKTKPLAKVVQKWFEPDFNHRATTLQAQFGASNHTSTGRLENGWNQIATTLAAGR
jgi:hypothetical protein